MIKKSAYRCITITLMTFLISGISCQKEEDNTGIIVKKEKLTGIVQKGPYTEAFISLYELNPALQQTGKKFDARITNNEGSFEIDNVALLSQYAELKANGYYYNEVTGDISSYHLTLCAISDIKETSGVNVNLLTHLEKERVKYLVQEGKNFNEAKDTAQKEILSIFGFSHEFMEESEKLDITVNKEDNAILLAVSVILLGDRNPRDLIELLNIVSTDLRQDGKLDDDSILQKLRSSAVSLDLATIRSNLEKRYEVLGISASIPDFEKYVNNFLSYSGLAPTVETLEAADISTTGATLNGTVNANDLSTIVTFEYGTTTLYGSTIQASPAVAAGHALTAVTADLTGLIPATLYHFRIKTVNSQGQSYGNDLTFTTIGKMAKAQTQEATNISSESVTLNGIVNANDLVTIVTFEYGISEEYGSSIIATPGQVTGHEDNNVSSVVAGLTIGTVYHCRIKAVNSLGTVYGSDITFTTLGKIPAAVTQDASSVSTEGGVLNGTVNANDLITVVTFEYGTTEAYGSTVSAAPGQVTGHEYTIVSSLINGLEIGTAYHFRVKTVNALGTVYGNDLTFTTLGKIPAAVTRAATDLSLEGAILNGTVNANDLSTVVTFEYGTTEAYGSTLSATPGEVTGHENTNVSSLINGLEIGTEYHFRVKTVNVLGTVYGNDLTFTTLGKIPTAITWPAKDLSSESATLVGTVNPNDLSTVVTFEYGTTEALGNTVSAVPGEINGNVNINVSCVISGLTHNSVYYFRVKTVNALGTAYGLRLSFKTPGGVPSATTSKPGAIRGTSAILNGIVNANYFNTDVTFEYGESTSYGNIATAAQSPLNGGSNTYVSIPVTGLIPETLYHFRIKAANLLGTSYGNDLTFITPPALVYDVDGNAYTAIAVGKQVWMAENLRTTRFNDRTPISLMAGNRQWEGLVTPGYCWYQNDEVKYKLDYGAIYNWLTLDTLINGRKNICPAGWHLPSSDEWTELLNYIGGENSSRKLIETGTSHWLPPNSSATNETGFSCLPGGYRSYKGDFLLLGSQAYFYTSSSSYNRSSVYGKYVSISPTYIYYPSMTVDNRTGYSIRCIMDK